MKVAFFTHYTTLYGANRSLLNLIDHLLILGIKPLVIAPSVGEITKVLEENNISFIVHHFKKDFVDKRNYKGFIGFKKRLMLFYYNFRKAQVIAEELKGKGIDLIYTNSSVMYIGFFVSKFLKIPHLWHIREFAELHYNYTPNLGYKLFNLMLSNTSAKVFVSKCLKSYYVPDSDTTSHVVYNGIAPKDTILKYKNNKKNNHASGSSLVVFCMVGQISPEKGQLEAVKAVDLLNKKDYNIQLVIAGEGNANSIMSYLNDNNIQNVKFLGHVDNPFSVFSASDITLMCSRNEAMGRVTIESMSVKTPVIGRNSAGTSELIEHNVTGLLYEGSHIELAQQMERMILDENLRGRLAENSWYWAYQNFNQEKYGNEIYNIIKQIT